MLQEQFHWEIDIYTFILYIIPCFFTFSYIFLQIQQRRKAADEKSKTWTRYKRFPTYENKQVHVNSCKKMKDNQKLGY